MWRISKPYGTPIPSTNDNTIVFPYNPIYNKFNVTDYTPDLTNNRMSMQELYIFLQGLETQIQLCTKKSGKTGLLGCFCLLFLLVVTVAIFVPVFGSTLSIEESKMLFCIVSALLFLGFSLFCFCLVRFTLKNQRGMKQVAEQAKAYIKENEKVFEAKGLKWVVPLYYPSWIELWKDKAPEVQLSLSSHNQKGYQIISQQDLVTLPDESDRTPIASP